MVLFLKVFRREDEAVSLADFGNAWAGGRVFGLDGHVDLIIVPDHHAFALLVAILIFVLVGVPALAFDFVLRVQIDEVCRQLKRRRKALLLSRCFLLLLYNFELL